MRLDKFLKVTKIIKRRSVANEAADNGRISVNGKTAKASYEVKVGDVIQIKFGNSVSKFEVIEIPKGQNAILDQTVKILQQWRKYVRNEIVNHLQKSEEDIENGRTTPATEVFKELRKEYGYYI